MPIASSVLPLSKAALALRVNGRCLAFGPIKLELEGWLDQQAAHEFLQATDILCIPSRIESIPVIFSDAMQLATPIICTPVGDLPRLHERHQFGIIADASTERALAAAIRSGLQASPADFADAVTRASKDFDVAEAARKFLQNLSPVSE